MLHNGNAYLARDTLIGKRIEIPDAFPGAQHGLVTQFHYGIDAESDYVTVKMDHPSFKRSLKLFRPDWDFVKFL